ncbi:MAG: hypothetical protein ABH919_03610 [bacterium]
MQIFNNKNTKKIKKTEVKNMGLTEGSLKRFGRARIISVFKEEAKTYSEIIEIPEELFIQYVKLHLSGEAVPEKAQKVIEIFEERVNFYSRAFPAISAEAIKNVLKTYLE